MALKFGNTKGKAESKKVDTYKYIDGENVVRLVGDIQPRYMYWLKGTNGKDVPVECLAFNREKEKFDNVERDPVPEYFPDVKCSWSYSINCIDVKGDGKVKVLQLKKKMFGEIQNAAETLGDPTDPKTGWDVVFKKVKTGPLPFNVEYQLMPLKCKPRALSEEELAAVAADPGIDAKLPRPSVEEVVALLEKITSGGSEDEEVPADTPAGEAAKDL